MQGHIGVGVSIPLLAQPRYGFQHFYNTVCPESNEHVTELFTSQAPLSIPFRHYVQNGKYSLMSLAILILPLLNQRIIDYEHYVLDSERGNNKRRHTNTDCKIAKFNGRRTLLFCFGVQLHVFCVDQANRTNYY